MPTCQTQLIAPPDAKALADEQILAIIEEVEPYLIKQATEVAALGNKPGNADDYAQDFRLAVYRALKRWRAGKKQPKTWAFDTIKLWAKHIRTYSRKHDRSSLFSPIIQTDRNQEIGLCEEETGEKAAPYGIVSEDELPESPEKMQDAERIAAIRAAVATLPEQTRRLAEAIMECNGNANAATKLLGIPRSEYYRRYKPEIEKALRKEDFGN